MAGRTLRIPGTTGEGTARGQPAAWKRAQDLPDSHPCSRNLPTRTFYNQ